MCKINFLFEKFVGGKQSIVVAGTGWAYFILFYFENQEGNSIPWFYFYMFAVISSTMMVIVVGTDLGGGLRGLGPILGQKKKNLAGQIFHKYIYIYGLGPPLVFSSSPPPKNHELLAQLARPGGKSP